MRLVLIKVKWIGVFLFSLLLYYSILRLIISNQNAFMLALERVPATSVPTIFTTALRKVGVA
jgi:hypothetical protein